MKRPLIFPILPFSTVSLQCPFKKAFPPPRFSGTLRSALDATVVVVCVPRPLQAALVLWASAGGRLLYWGSGKGTAVSKANGQGKVAWKGARCWPECSKPLSQVLRASLPFPRWLGPSRGHVLRRASLLPCGHTPHRAVVPPAPADCLGQPGGPTGASPRLWLGLLS